MNKKDYDTIAKIIKNNTAPEENRFNDLSVVGDCLIEDLADYFEKESEEIICPNCDGTGKLCFCNNGKLKNFNK